MSGDNAILIIAALVLVAVVAGVTAVMRCLHRPQRIVVLVGTLAAAGQVVFPPCLGVGRPPNYDPEPAGRHLLPPSYEPVDAGFWIDGHRLAIELSVTVVMTAIGCGLVRQWHRPTGQLQLPGASPVP